MHLVEILTVGREILDGRVLDTNAVEIAQALKPLGLTPRFGQRVDDDLHRAIEAFVVAGSRSDVVIVTGGLGPTSDDLTTEAFARFAGLRLELSPTALEAIEARLRAFGREMTDVQRKQALFPPGATVLQNPEGSAPGFMIDYDGTRWFFMPGVPREMRRMLKEQVLCRLPATPGARSMTWATQFTSEGTLQEKLTPIERRLKPGFEITYRTHFPENHVGLYVSGVTDDGPRDFDAISGEISQALGEDVFSSAKDDSPLLSLEEIVIAKIKDRGLMLATVESCTGGLVANRLTNVSGASAIYWGGCITYDNSAKYTLVDVPPSLVAAHGAVSREVAMAMAEGGLRRMSEALAHQTGGAPARDFICVATTGIAGPTGGSAEKPVGLCFIGLAISGEPTRYDEVRGRPGLAREQYKTLFAQKALDLIRRFLL